MKTNVVFCFLLLIVVASCRKNSDSSVGSSDNNSSDTLLSDSIVTNEKEKRDTLLFTPVTIDGKEGDATYSLTFSYPIGGNSTQVRWLREWSVLLLCGELKLDSARSTPSITSKQYLAPQSVYKGDLAEPSALAKYCMSSYFLEYQKDQERTMSGSDQTITAAVVDVVSDGDGGGMETHKADEVTNFGPDETLLTYYSKKSLDVVYQIPDLLTYLYEGETYMGGAHGSPFAAYYVFNMKDNCSLTFDDVFLQNSHRELRHLILKGLQRSVFPETKSIDELLDQLFLPADADTPDTFPFPSSMVGITADGVVFVYQPYEITAFCYGMPKIVIPYREVWNLFTPGCRELLRNSVTKVDETTIVKPTN